MNPLSQYDALFKLPVAERIELVEALWSSIAAESSTQPESPEVIALVQERMARYKANPGSGMSWEEAQKRMRDT
jgi:putative addiction module component (TIGR02574 family)